MSAHRGAVILLLLIGVLLAGCGGSELLPSGDVGTQLGEAAFYLEEGSEEKALEAYQIIARTYPGTEYEEAARMGIARAHRKMKDYATAIRLYETFLRRFPRSEYVDDAAYETALCYADQRKKFDLDPEMNRKALAAFQDFIARYPRSELVDEARGQVAISRDEFARKALENGITYEKLRRYGAARFYFQVVLDDYPESKHAAEALYRIAETHRRQKHLDEARESATELARRFPGSPWTEKLSDEIAGAGALPEGGTD